MRSNRWPIAFLVTAAIAISYLDRQTLSVAIKAIECDIAIPDEQFGQLQAAFLITYAVMYMAGGRLIDALGTRRGFLLIMIWWSLACAGHGLARGLLMLAGCRLMLGLAEGGAFPAAAKAVAEWFPVRERSTAMGLINGGSAVGAVIAPPAIALVLAHAHWPWVFFLSGAVGLVWTVWWLWDYYPPDEHPRLSAAERYELRDLLVTPQQQQQSSVSWWRLFSLPQVWGMVVGKGLCDAVWFTYIAWLPKYFQEMHGFSNAQMGYIIWIPYAASGVGSVVGGWCSSRLLRSGYSLNFSRKAVLGASAALMPCIALITYVPAALAIALFSIAFFAHLSFSTLVISLPADLFPRRMVGTVVGLVGFGGSMGGMLFNLVAGYVLSYYGRAAGYPLVFAVGSTLHILSFFWILLTIRDVRPVEFPEKAAWEQPVPLPVP